MFNMRHQGKEIIVNDPEDIGSDFQEPLDVIDPPDEDEESPYRDPPEGCVRLRPSQFLGIPSTVFVEYPPELGIRRNDNSSVEPLGSRKMGYKSYWERICIKNAHIRAGFVKSEKYWTSLWSKHQNADQMKELNCLQKINHFPASWCIGRKDRLTRTLNTMKRVHGSNGNVFNFHPETFILPGERDALHRLMKTEISSAITASSNGKTYKTFNSSSTTMSVAGGMWIVKPCAASCGQGIKVMTGQQVLELPKKKKVIVQRYLARPYLIDGRKFDLRIYVLVSGVDPLRVYIHDEGLTRISTAKYSVKNLSNSYVHLTNYSINKNAPNFKAAEFKETGTSGSEEASDCQEEDDTMGVQGKAATEPADPEMEGFKWSLAAFRRWLVKREGRDVMERTFDRIFDLCLKTMIAAESEITPHLHSSAQYRSNCFELFGCDVILDSDLCPNLLEVNVSPSLMGSSPLDKKIKGMLIADILHIVGMYPHDPALLRKYDAGFGRTGEGVLRRGKDSIPANPFAFSSLSKLMSAQDRYRRDPGPDSIDIAALGDMDASWLLLLMAEDELQRARSSKFHCVHPSSNNAAYYSSLYRSGRFSDHLLAHWVSNGGSEGRYRKLIPHKFRPREQHNATTAATSPSKSPSSTGTCRQQQAPLSGSGTLRQRAKSAGRVGTGTTRQSTYIPAAMLQQPSSSNSAAKVRPLREVVVLGTDGATGARSSSLSPRGGKAATSTRKSGDSVGDDRRARKQIGSEADHTGRRHSRGHSEPRRKGSQPKTHADEDAPSAPVVPLGFLGSPTARPLIDTITTPVSGLRSRLESGISQAAEIYGPCSPPSNADTAMGNSATHTTREKQKMSLGAGFKTSNVAVATAASKSHHSPNPAAQITIATSLGPSKEKASAASAIVVPAITSTRSRPSSAQRRGQSDSSKGSRLADSFGLSVLGGGPAACLVRSTSNGSNLSVYATGSNSSSAGGGNALQGRTVSSVSTLPVSLLGVGDNREKLAPSADVGAGNSSPLKQRRTVGNEAGEQLFAQIQRTLHLQQSTSSKVAAGSSAAIKSSKV